jgi:hypothetical protein
MRRLIARANPSAAMMAMRFSSTPESSASVAIAPQSWCIGSSLQAGFASAGRSMSSRGHACARVCNRRIPRPVPTQNAQNTSVPGMSGEPTEFTRRERPSQSSSVDDRRGAADTAFVGARDRANPAPALPSAKIDRGC